MMNGGYGLFIFKIFIIFLFIFFKMSTCAHTKPEVHDYVDIFEPCFKDSVLLTE